MNVPNEKSDHLTALSLFSGAGGMDLGVARAGFKILACIEVDHHCCSTLRANEELLGGGVKILEKDIREVDPQSLRKELGLEPGELALLYGGPPCQPFSQIGKQKGLKDARGLLLFQIPRFAEVFLPQAIFVEQVPGFVSARDTTGRRGGVLELFLRDLAKLGYTAKWKILNAADYGVPQLRKRVFIVATHGQNGFRFPEPTHTSSPCSDSFFSLKPYVTVGEAIRGLGAPTRKNGQPRKDSHVDVTPMGDVKRIHGVPEGSYLAAQTHLPKEQLGKLTRKDSTKYMRVSRTAPSKTLRGGEIFFHPLEDRYLTPREYMRIHGFPDEYILCGPIRSRSGQVKDLDQHRQVANSVPPPLAEALAAAIIRSIFCQSCSKSLVTR